MSFYTVEAKYKMGDRVKHPMRIKVGTIIDIEWSWSKSKKQPGRAVYTVIFEPSKSYGKYTRRYVTDDEIEIVEV